MTTPYTIEKIWPDATVAVLGNGPTLAADLAAATFDHCIAANSAILHKPDADMLVSIDGNWPVEADSFTGLRIVGIESDADALFVPMPYERVTLGPGNVIELRNNTLSAIRIAAQAGAATILLLGFDTEAYEEIHNFPGLTIALASLVAELQAQGVSVQVPAHDVSDPHG